jgi:ribonucleoside-triphosphate reductase (formate)
LAFSLKEKYGIEDKDKVLEILKIHGLDDDKFDFVNYVHSVINGNLNDLSIDSNSNKNEKTIEAIHQEALAPVKKAVGYDYLYRKMKELYGKKEAKHLTGEMYDLSLGLADSTNILRAYCWALDASKITTIGRPFGQLHSKPSKRVSSYISALCESVHQLTSHLAGAIAVSSFFLDVAHLSLYKERYDLREIRTNKRFRKRLENEFQQFVHSLNHLSRNGAESAFTNISVFDRVKLITILKEMAWYFPIDDLPIDKPNIDSEEELKSFYDSYIIDYIMEIQNIFLDFFDQGDPLKGGAPYRFPIISVNLSKSTKDGKEIIDDTKFLRSICKRDIYKYNIFVSEGTKLASCCRLLSNSELLEFASQSNSFGAGGSLSIGSHRVCTINFVRIALEAIEKRNKDILGITTKEYFFEILKSRIFDTAKILISHRALLKDLIDKKLQPFFDYGWLNLNRMFSTFGIIGIYEASKLLKENGITGDIEKDILTFLNSLVGELSKKHSVPFNIEQIPAESYAIRFADVDKLLYGKEKQPFEMYSNQFIPLWEEATLWERLDKDGMYNKLVTGGGIVHAQIGERVTSKQAEKIIKYAVNAGAEHFALNSIYSECVDNHTTFGDSNICPICGKDIIEKYTRVVGFFTPISSWNTTRREWEFPRRTFVSLE